MVQDPEKSIRDWFREMERYTQNLDFTRARKLMAADVLAFSTRTNVMTGIDALVEDQWTPTWPRLRDFTYDLDQLHVRVSGDFVLAVVPWNSTGFDSDGRSFLRPGRATIILEQQNGDWLAIHSHYSLAPGTPPTTHRPGA